MIPKKIKRDLFLISSVSILAIFAHHGLANNRKSGTDIRVCNKILKFSGLHREMIEEQSNKDKYLKISEMLEKENFLLPYNSLQEEGSVEFKGIDIDKDGKNDEVVRSCGAGAGGICTLFVTYSSGGKNTSEEMGRFYLGRLGDDVYLIEEIYAGIYPYTNKNETRIFHISHNSIERICDKNS